MYPLCDFIIELGRKLLLSDCTGNNAVAYKMNCVKCFLQILKMSQEKFEIFESDLSDEREKRKQSASDFITIQNALKADSEVLPLEIMFPI